MKIKQILIVDDSNFFTELIKSSLKDMSCDLLSAKDGKEALDILAGTTPDLMLLDQNLPDIKGDQFCSMIRNNPKTKNLRVIIITAHDETDTIEKCFGAGCNDFVKKPINWPELKDKVGKQINLTPH